MKSQKQRLSELIALVIKDVLAEDRDVDDKFLKSSFDAQIDKHLLQLVKSAESTYDELDYTPDTALPGEDTKEEKETEEKQSGESTKHIDMDAFLTGVQELVENFMNVIEIKTTLYRRAVRVLKQTQDQETVSDFKEALKERGEKIGESEKDFEAEEFRAPPAAGAGPGGGGAV